MRILEHNILRALIDGRAILTPNKQEKTVLVEVPLYSRITGEIEDTERRTYSYNELLGIVGDLDQCSDAAQSLIDAIDGA